jgi:DNA repair photolyase
MALGSNTDPYQPAERGLRITRGVLEVLAEHAHPFGIVTKSNLVLRDLDIIAPMAARGLAHVAISVTTLDRELARRMEPRAAAPDRRLAAIGALRDAGVPAAILAAPMIPGLNDAELERILEAAARAGAQWAGYILLRLPWELKGLFEEWLRANYPLKAERVLSLVRETRGGALNQPEFGTRMRGTGAIADLLRDRFAVARRRLGLDGPPAPLDTSQFRIPPRAGAQLRLYE